MLVRCEPFYEGDLRSHCGEVYDDEFRWAICPHKSLNTSPYPPDTHEEEQ